jgi:hypothetical protein
MKRILFTKVSVIAHCQLNYRINHLLAWSIILYTELRVWKRIDVMQSICESTECVSFGFEVLTEVTMKRITFHVVTKHFWAEIRSFSWFIWHTTWPWRWKLYVLSKRRWTSNELHDIITQKIVLSVCDISRRRSRISQGGIQCEKNTYYDKGYCSFYKPLLQCIIDACDVISEIASTSSERPYMIMCESKYYSICTGYYTCAISKKS